MDLLHHLGLLMLAPALDLALQALQAQARRDELIEFLAISVLSLARRAAEDLAEPGDHAGVDRVILGQLPGRPGEVADPLGVDDQHFQAGLTQQCRPAPLVAATGFHHGLANSVLAQPIRQLSSSLRVVGKRRFRTGRPYRCIDLSLGDVEADKRAVLCHPPLPSLLGSGSTAHATVRVKEDIGRSLAPSQAQPLGSTGSRSTTGGCVNSRPFAYSAKVLRHKGS